MSMGATGVGIMIVTVSIAFPASVGTAASLSPRQPEDLDLKWVDIVELTVINVDGTVRGFF
jgi:hypothetical protein